MVAVIWARVQSAQLLLKFVTIFIRIFNAALEAPLIPHDMIAWLIGGIAISGLPSIFVQAYGPIQIEHMLKSLEI